MPSPGSRHRPARIALAGAVMAVVACLACLHGPGAGAATAPSVKAPIRGLIDRQGVPDTDALAYVHGYVVNVSWADLQPSRTGGLVAGNLIDQAIARVRQPDLAGKVSLKLRVVAGIGAPEWAKSIGGAPIPYLNNQTGASTPGGTIGRFWLPAYGKAYNRLQALLAAKYDGVPEIREVTVDRCSTIYDELFARQPLPANAAALASAGYTAAADQLCIQQAIAAHDVWKQTTSDVAFSPFPDVLDGGRQDNAFTLSMMDYCRQALGVRCGLENNALSTDKLANTRYQELYGRMRDLGGQVTFQTATSARIGDWQAAMDGGVQYGAMSIELPYGYQTWSASELAAFDAALRGSTAR